MGDFDKLLRLKEIGNRVIHGAHEFTAYREAFNGFFRASRVAKKELLDDVVCLSYQHLFAVTKTFERINSRYDSIKNCSGAMMRLGKSIAIMLPELLPADSGLSMRIRDSLVSSIVVKVNPAFNVAEVIEAVEKR